MPQENFTSKTNYLCFDIRRIEDFLMFLNDMVLSPQCIKVPSLWEGECLEKKWLLSMIEEFKKDISNEAKIDFFSSICFRDKNIVENLLEQYIWQINFLYICSKDMFFVFFFSVLKNIMEKMAQKNFTSKLIIYVLIRIENFLMFSNDVVPLAWCAKGEAHSFQWCERECF